MKIATKTRCLYAAGLLLGTAIPSLAQAAPSTQSTPVTALAPANAPAMGAMPMDATLLAPMDRLFMTRAAEGNLAEITLSQLALRKSKNESVRMIAQILINEHTMAQTELQAAATHKGVLLPTMLSPTHLAVQQNLSKARRDDFDKMYLANQVDDHENTIALFTNEISLGQDPDARAQATKYLPNILGHTAMIYNVARQVGAPGIELRPATPPAPPGVIPTPMSAMMPTGTTAPDMTH